MKKNFMWIGLAILIVVIVAGLFVYKSGSATGNANSGTPTVVITLNASRFQYDPGTITVHKGDLVKIVINSLDTTHGIAIPDFGVSGVDSVQFVADKTGTFQFHCPTPCGPGHRDMVGTLIVE